MINIPFGNLQINIARVRILPCVKHYSNAMREYKMRISPEYRKNVKVINCYFK